MKKLLAFLLCLLTLLALAGCGRKVQYVEFPNMVSVLDQNEYTIYQNVFFNDQADDYLGKKETKLGTLTRLIDPISGQTHYYIWGYMDATKCCDWQWEIVPKDPDALPPSGTLVNVTGTLVRDDAAIDKIRIIDAEVSTEKAVSADDPAPCDVDTTTMNATLERVQIGRMLYYMVNMQHPGAYDGQSIRFYGRVSGLNTVQHPYYDNAWTQTLLGDQTLPAIGTMVIVTGVWEGSDIRALRVEPTPYY